MRFKKRPHLPGAERTRAWHYHGSHTSTSPGTILLGKMASSKMVPSHQTNPPAVYDACIPDRHVNMSPLYIYYRNIMLLALYVLTL